MPVNLYSEFQTEQQPIGTPQRALAVGAHPDDVEFGCGGTLAKWATAGCSVAILIMTDGSKGTWDPDRDPAALVADRQSEARRAAAELGADDVLFAGHADGELEYSMALRAEVCDVIRKLRPDVVLSHDPWQRYQLHPDHRATGWAAVDGVVAARDHLFFPEQGLAAHRPSDMLLWSADEPNHWEDIEGYVEPKIAALLCHASQGTTTMGGAEQDDDRRRAFEVRVNDWAVATAEPVGMAAAESFRRIEP